MPLHYMKRQTIRYMITDTQHFTLSAQRLEEQLNDLTELHQKEIENCKQTITDLEEKIQYQTEERHRDVHEMLESFQTRVCTGCGERGGGNVQWTKGAL